MRLPVMLYDVMRGTGPDDRAAVAVVTTRLPAAADELVRELMRRRGRGEFEGAPEFWSAPRAAELDVDVPTTDAAKAVGYELRMVLAPLEAVPSEPPAEEPVLEESLSLAAKEEP